MEVTHVFSKGLVVAEGLEFHVPGIEIVEGRSKMDGLHERGLSYVAEFKGMKKLPSPFISVTKEV